jgi:DNA-binding transcriptional LysR family regulator
MLGHLQPVAGVAVELRHLRYLLAVAEEGTFVRAAKRLRIAQPALSRQIRDLEREIGTPLFERGARSVRISAAGEACLRGARAILADTVRALDHARRSSHGLAGRCVVAVGKLPTWNGLAARLVAHAQREYPQVELVIREAHARPQWDALRDGSADLGIGMAPADEFTDLAFAPVGNATFDGAMVSKSSQLASRARLTLAELADETLVLLGADAVQLRLPFADEFARLEFAPTRVLEVSDVTSVFASVAAGRAWVPFPTSLAEWAPLGTVVIPVDRLGTRIPLYAIWVDGEERAVVRTVLSLLLEIGGAETDSDAASAARVVGSGAVEEPRPPLGLELRHFRYFAAVAEERSIGRAAERLGLTQPALSRQLRDLEREVGVNLVERASRGIVLTPAGESLYETSAEILRTAVRLPAEAQRAARGVSRRCVLATIPTPIVSQLVARVVRDSLVEQPDVVIELTECPTIRQPEALLSAAIDLGICHAFSTLTVFHATLLRHRLIDDPVCCVLLPIDHDLARREEITITELDRIPFLFMPRSLYPGFYDWVMETFAAQGFHPNVERAYDGLETTWALAREGKGWCIGFQSYLRLPPAGLVAVPVAGLSLDWGIDVVHRRDETRGAVFAVLEIIRRAADEAVSEARRQ